MVGDINFGILIYYGAFWAVVVCLALWGAWELIDWLWIADGIRSETPITPTLELIVKDNKVDTIYFYPEP